MGFLTLSRREGEMIRLTIDPGVDTEKFLKQLLRDRITVHIGAIKRHGRARISIEAPKQMMAVVDQINQREGRGTVRIGRVPAVPAWAMRREMLSPRYTTRWSEVIGVRG